MRFSRIFQTVCCGALLTCTSCGSLFSHTTTKKEVGPYPGVRDDVYLLAHPRSIREPPIHPAVVVPVSIIDIPLSAALDTLLLPIDLTYRESKAPAALELELRTIKLSAASRGETPERPSSVPVLLRLRNPRPRAIKIPLGRLAHIVSCCDYQDAEGHKWEFTWGGFGAIYDPGAVLAVEGQGEAEFELTLLAGKEILRLYGHPAPTGMGAPASLQFRIRDSHIQTESGAWIPIAGSGTVSVQ
jgi:uncharacterized protein YceK